MITRPDIQAGARSSRNDRRFLNVAILLTLVCKCQRMFSPSICSTKACAATFSLVSIMRLRLGSNTSRPTTRMAADLVLPAPKTPLIGRSVLPSSKANTSEPMVERTCSSGLHNKGYIALIRASSAALLVQQPSQPIANFSNFTAAEKSRFCC